MPSNFYIIIYGIVIFVIAFILYRYFKTEKFDDVIKENKIILYYSPSCGHCHAFMSTWDKFANDAQNLNIIATKVNCTENECPNITGYPTVLLHKQDGSTVTFNGQRTIEHLSEFVKQNQ